MEKFGELLDFVGLFVDKGVNAFKLEVTSFSNCGY